MKVAIRFTACAALLCAVGCGETPNEATDSSMPLKDANNVVAPKASLDAAAENPSAPVSMTTIPIPNQGPAQEEDILKPADPEVVPNKPADAEEFAVEAGSLGLGDAAPPLAVASIAQGDAVASTFSDDGQITVVEFWATWCPPCRDSMPHMSKLQDNYGDKVRFIGFSDEKPEVVDNFLEKKSGDKTWAETVTYTLAMDKNGETSRRYMTGAGQSGIPTAFIVGRTGKLEWIGHPMSMDEPLEKIVAGEWDLEQAVAEAAAAKEAEEAMNAAQAKLRKAVNAGDWDGAIAIIDELRQKFPDNEGLTMTKLSFLQNAGDNAGFSKFAAEVAEQKWDDAQTLNYISWAIAGEQTGEGRDLELASKAALQASKLTDDSNGAIMDTVARVYFEQGDVQQAIAWQKKAVKAAPAMADLKEALKTYEAAAKPADKDESKDADAAKESTEADAGKTEEKPEEKADEKEAEKEESAEKKDEAADKKDEAADKKEEK